MRVKCNECGKVFKVSGKSVDVECPKCGGVDVEPEVNYFYRPAKPVSPVSEPDYGGAFDGFAVSSDADGGL